MKNYVLVFLFASIVPFAIGVNAGESAAVKESQPVGSVSPLSKEEMQKGIENGALCSDAKGLANSRGAIIEQNGKIYRCVKVYGENFSEHKKLVWVELAIKNGEAVTAD